MVEINLKIITKENVEPLVLPTEKQMRFVDFLLYLQEMLKQMVNNATTFDIYDEKYNRIAIVGDNFELFINPKYNDLRCEDVVMLHPSPLEVVVLGTTSPSKVLEEERLLQEIINNYPNVLLFSGHTHWTLDSVQPALYGNKEKASFVNCASVGYLWNDSDTNEPGSEGIYVDVYEDYVFIKGREFLDRKWVSSTQLVFPKYKNDF